MPKRIPPLPRRGDDKPETLLEEAKRRFKQASQASQKQREREREDLKFQTPEHQWDESAKRARLGEAVAGVPTPPRPILSVSKIDHPIQMVVNQFYQAQLAIIVHQRSPNADDETASVIQGIYRSTETNTAAPALEARGWAFDRCVKAGLGYYLVDTEYDDSSDNPSDQRIVLRRILHQELVMFDPSATRADFSDADFAFGGGSGWMQYDSFKEQYPTSKTTSALDVDFKASVVQAPEWAASDMGGGQRGVFVQAYWYKIHDRTKVKVGGREIERDDVKVRRALLTYWDILDDQPWPGKLIPIIPVIGREVQGYDGQRRWTGLIGPNKDAQRLYNYAISAAVELVALEPKAPFIGAEGQFEGLEEFWLNANTRNQPFLEYRKVATEQGQPFPPPQRSQVDVNKLGPTMILVQSADTMLQAGTSTYPVLGRERPQEKSGKAIQSLQAQGQEATSDFLQNMASISMPYESRVVLELIPVVYDRPERILHMLNENGESEMVMVNQPHYIHPSTKKPTPIDVVELKSGEPKLPLQPAPGQAMPMAPSPNPALPPRPPKIKYFDLAGGKYSVTIDIGRSPKTVAQEGGQRLAELLQADPSLWPALGPEYMKYQDFPGAKEAARILLKIRNQQMPFLNEPSPGEDMTPEQSQALVSQLQQQVKALTQQLQQAGIAIKTDQAKQQVTLAKTKMETESRERIAGAQISSDERMATMEKKLDIIQALLQHAHEGQMADKDAAHEVGLEAEKAKHDMATGIVEHATAAQPPMLAPPNLNAPPQSAGQPLEPPEGIV